MDRFRRSLWIWVGFSAIYGAFVRVALKNQLDRYLGVGTAPFALIMSFAFVIAVPTAMGYLAVAKSEAERPMKWYAWIFVPWLPVIVGIGTATLLAWEGAICVVFFAPVGLVMSSLGGVAAGIVARNVRRAALNYSIAFVLLLPILIAPIEARIPSPFEIRTVENDILIHASPDRVWQNIERVPLIQAQELPRSWNRTIGFPRPMEATLSREGLGGVRHATFAGNVLFVETIDVWEPQRQLGFGIKADTVNIPPTTLDEHVTIGGPFFDVLHGQYILEPRANGDVLLRLVSNHRLSTHLNWYARLWSEAVMSDIQRSILHVIKNRCEAH